MQYVVVIWKCCMGVRAMRAGRQWGLVPTEATTIATWSAYPLPLPPPSPLPPFSLSSVHVPLAPSSCPTLFHLVMQAAAQACPFAITCVCLPDDVQEGVTALHLAAQNGHLSIVKWLLAEGADKEQVDEVRRGSNSVRSDGNGLWWATATVLSVQP